MNWRLQLCCAASMLWFVMTGAVRSAERPPNILFMFADDQAFSSTGYSGNEHIQTPNMDRLASRGRSFSNGFVTTAICCTSRASILTGQHMRRHGIDDFKKPLSAEAWKQTYPMLLREAGYRTGYLGKLAVGNPAQAPKLSLPKEEFDFWYAFPQSFLFGQEVNGRKVHLTAEMTRRVTQFLRTNPADKPFCLTVAYKEPHGPWDYFDPDVPDAYVDAQIPFPETFTREAYDKEPDFVHKSLNGDNSDKWLQNSDGLLDRSRTVYRLISQIDNSIGKILAELDRLGLADNTIIIYSSDHGQMLGAHGGLSGKWLMYEESIRVPFLIYDPRKASKFSGKPSSAMALNIDIAPTILDYAGVEIPAAIQGRSLVRVVDGDESNWRNDWYYEHTYNTSPPRSPIAKTEGVRTTRWKYTRYPDHDLEQLFDLKSDPHEQTNLAKNPDFAATLDRLRARCEELRRQAS